MAPRSRRGFLAGAAIVALFAVPVLVVEPVRVSSESMSPAYRAGDRVLVDKLAYVAGRSTPRHREVIVFTHPTTGKLLIKRVVGVAGDTVALADGTLVVNGVEVAESFLDRPALVARFFGPVTVPPDSVFVMGDDRADSVDSRSFGAVPTTDVIGRVLGGGDLTDQTDARRLPVSRSRNLGACAHAANRFDARRASRPSRPSP